jgi:CRP-like cAMP-binding protein
MNTQWVFDRTATFGNDPAMGDWLTDEIREELRALGSWRTLIERDTLFREGDEPYDVLLIESGELKLITTAANGIEVVLDVVGPGEVIGELSAVDGATRSATAVALTDVCVTAVRSEVFMDFLVEKPSSMRQLFRVTVQRLRESNARQLEYASADALGRVCRRLEDIAKRSGAPANEPTSIELGLTQAEFAQWCGLSREAVVKAFRTLRTLGWVEQEGGSVTLNERVGLRARAAQ